MESKMKTIHLQDIEEAADRINSYIRHTPLLREGNLDSLLNCKAYLKPEMLQITGAFKIRGAFSKVLTLSEEERKRGIITSSSGNHGQACAYLGKYFQIPVVVVVPEKTPDSSIAAARANGARVEVLSPDYDTRWNWIHKEAEEQGYTIVHPFEDNFVAAGQGTIGLEILKDLPDVDTVVVPIGGGGLISGIATAVKEIRPQARVIGIQPANSAPYYASRVTGKPTEIPYKSTIANGLACRKPGIYPYPIIEKYVDDIILVEEEEIAQAVKLLGEKAKLVGEPSACVGIAAALSGKLNTRPDEKVAFVLTSGNWDVETIGRFYKNEPVDGIL
ncbi:MAG: threonine/serine dehydratase [Lachnospiraceae bacterium]|nr:threonine/serine dehydratase [Lachnospiraceae bacterium]MDD3616404.1 threonine/serine dehydratase [Lachnospiraceae bacterium]